jgi:thymidylate kinase
MFNEKEVVRMIVILEGMDRCGKDTQANAIINHYVGCSFHQIHYSKTPKLTPQASLAYANRLYHGMFKLADMALESDLSLIINRSHLGENVYGHYRGYDGAYVFELEREYGHLMNDIYLFVLVDEPTNALEREDGDSWGKTLGEKQDEKARFEDAYYFTSIVNKTLINISGKNVETVSAIILDRLSTSKVYE